MSLASERGALRHALAHKVEECKLASRDTVLVDKTTGEVAAEDGAKVIIWDLLFISAFTSPRRRMMTTHPFNDLVQPNLLKQDVRQCLFQD